MSRINRLAKRLQAYADKPQYSHAYRSGYPAKRPPPPRGHARPAKPATVPLPSTPAPKRDVQRRSLSTDDLEEIFQGVQKREGTSPHIHAEAERLLSELRNEDVATYYALQECLRRCHAVANRIGVDPRVVSFASLIASDEHDDE